jgi:hypothetical protein
MRDRARVCRVLRDRARVCRVMRDRLWSNEGWKSLFGIRICGVMRDENHYIE